MHLAIEVVTSSEDRDSAFASTCFGEVDGEAPEGEGGEELSPVPVLGAASICPALSVSFL